MVIQASNQANTHFADEKKYSTYVDLKPNRETVNDSIMDSKSYSDTEYMQGYIIEHPDEQTADTAAKAENVLTNDKHEEYIDSKGAYTNTDKTKLFSSNNRVRTIINMIIGGTLGPFVTMLSALPKYNKAREIISENTKQQHSYLMSKGYDGINHRMDEAFVKLQNEIDKAHKWVGPGKYDNLLILGGSVLGIAGSLLITKLVLKAQADKTPEEIKAKRQKWCKIGKIIGGTVCIAAVGCGVMAFAEVLEGLL